MGKGTEWGGGGGLMGNFFIVYIRYMIYSLGDQKSLKTRRPS